MLARVLFSGPQIFPSALQSSYLYAAVVSSFFRVDIAKVAACLRYSVNSRLSRERKIKGKAARRTNASCRSTTSRCKILGISGFPNIWHVRKENALFSLWSQSRHLKRIEPKLCVGNKVEERSFFES